VDVTVDDRGQTDPAIAGASEGDEIGLAGQLSLGDVMVDHLGQEESSLFAATLENEQFVIRREAELQERLTAFGGSERFELEAAFPYPHLGAVDPRCHEVA